jgi:HK97 family phage prohead protease
MQQIEISHSILERGSKNAERAIRFERTGVLARSDDDEMVRPALEGFAARYNKLFMQKRRFVVLVRGAFEKSIGNGRQVDFIADHDKDIVYGRAEVLHHADGVAFRFVLPKSPTGYALRKMVANYRRSDISVGAKILNSETRVIGGRDVVFVTEASLDDISAVENGAVALCNARIIDAAKEPSLKDNSKFLMLDTIAAELGRAADTRRQNLARLERLGDDGNRLHRAVQALRG